MPKGVSIKSAEHHDFLGIAALDREVWKSNRDSEYIPDGEHVLRIWVEHALVYCAFDDDKRIGGAILAFPTTQGSYCVHKFFVEHELQGRRIGSQLFAVLLEKIDRLSVGCFLTVDPYNRAAISLFENGVLAENYLLKVITEIRKTVTLCHVIPTPDDT